MADIGTSFTVLSLGSSELLSNVLNGVAMMGSDGTFAGMAKVAALGGLVGTVFTAMVAQKFEYYKFLAAFVVYSLLFGATATVKVEDIYTGEIKPVANVPIGVAMPMALSSTVGYRLTKEFETVLSVPGATIKDGGIEALGWLARVRDLSLPDPRLSMTVSAYIQDCVLTSINTQDAEPDQITLDSWRTSGDLLTLMGNANYAAINTVTYLSTDPAGGTIRSCADAYTAFQPVLLAAMNDVTFQKNLGAQLGMTLTDTTGTPASDKLQAAKDAIAKTADDAKTYMTTALLQNEFRCKTEGLNDASCITLTEGSERRRTQWASEQAFFKQVARPMMAFAEAFMPLMAPMVLFVVLVAPAALGIVFHYFKLYASLALWTPLMAVVNAFLVSSVSGKLAVAATTVNTTSVSYLDSTWTTIADYVSVGGMMYASVPAIAYAMVTMGGGVMSTISSRAQSAAGGTDANATMSPALAQNGPVVAAGAGMQVAPGLVRDSMAGPMKSGGAEALKSWGSASAGTSSSSEEVSSASRNLTAAEQATKTARESYMTSLGSSIVDTVMSGNTRKEGSGSSREHATTSDIATNLSNAFGGGKEGAQAFQAGLDAAVKQNLSPADTGQLLTSIGQGVKAAQGKGLPVQTATGKMGGTASVTGKESQAINDAISSTLKSSDSHKATRSSSDEDVSSRTLAKAMTSQSVRSKSTELAKAEQTQAAAASAYQQAAKHQASQSAAGSVDAYSALVAMRQDAGLASKVADAATNGMLVSPEALQAAYKAVSGLGITDRGDQRNAAHALALIQGGSKANGALLDAMAESGRGVKAAPVGSMTPEMNRDIAGSQAAKLDDFAKSNGSAVGAVGASAPGGVAPSSGASAPASGATAPAAGHVANRSNPNRALLSGRPTQAANPAVTAPAARTAPALDSSVNNRHDQQFSADSGAADAMLRGRDADRRGVVLNRNEPDAAVKAAQHNLRGQANPVELARQSAQMLGEFTNAALTYAKEHPAEALTGLAVGAATTAAGRVLGQKAATAAASGARAGALAGLIKFASTDAGQKILKGKLASVVARAGTREAAAVATGPAAPVLTAANAMWTTAEVAGTARELYSAAKAAGYIK